MVFGIRRSEFQRGCPTRLCRRGLRVARAGLFLFLGILLIQVCVASETQTAPAFKLRDLEGRQIALEEVLKAGPALVVFWATCCSSTHPLMMHLGILQKRYGQSGFTVLAIAVDDSKTASRVRPWVLGRRLSYPILLDPAGDVMRLYHVTAIPHVMLIDGQRHIVGNHVGFLPGDEQVYEREIRQLLGLEGGADGDTR